MDDSTSVTVREIVRSSPYYQQERHLRNEILLRPIGLPDFGYEHRDHQSLHFVALNGDEVVGCVLLALDPRTKNGRLMQMAVRLAWQGKGVGRKLIDVLVKRSIELGLSEITCHAQERAIEFYDKVGFVAAGQRFVEADIWHLPMRRVLDGQAVTAAS